MTVLNATDWNSCRDPQPMLDVPQLADLSRKLRLFAVACVRRVLADGRTGWWLYRAISLINQLEQYAESKIDQDQFDEVVNQVFDIRYTISEETLDALEADFCSVLTAIDNEPWESAIWSSLNANIALSSFPKRPDRYEAGDSAESLHQARLLRCIIGNPFQPIPFSPSWITSTVRGVALAIYEGGAFDRLPILADALQDAGCENEAILHHCRHDAVHTRGCWVIDNILGKSR